MNSTRRNLIKTGVALAAGAFIAPHAFAKGQSFMSNIAAFTNTPQRPLCVFTKCLQYLDYEKLAITLACAGYDGADLSVRAGGHVLPENVKKDLPRLVSILQKKGITVPMMVTTITDPNDKFTELIIATAAEQGIQHYRMGYIEYDKKKTIPQNIDIQKRAVEKLEKINRKYQIHGAYQNHAGTRMGGPVWDLYLLLKDLDPQYIGVQYDIRHAVCEGGESWSLGMELLAPWIKSFPLKDFIWKKNGNQWKPFDVPLGEGMVNFDAFLKKYIDLRLSGPFSIHLEYDLGGADKGSRTPSMEHAEIATYLKRDIDWFRKKLKEYNLE